MSDTATLELTFTIEPEPMEGGYTRYVSHDLPGFRILCEPNENPLPLIEQLAWQFLPAAISAVMQNKLVLKGLRITSEAKTLFKGTPGNIGLAAQMAHAA